MAPICGHNVSLNIEIQPKEDISRELRIVPKDTKNMARVKLAPFKDWEDIGDI